jgi:sugar phosphate isomerase/epimerase
MKLQNYESRNQPIVEKFIRLRENLSDRRLNLGWSNWQFGMESLDKSVERLSRLGVGFIELHGNRYGPDLGYDAKEVRKITQDHGVEVSGVCGMVSPDSELSSNKPHITQRAIDYFRRNIELCAEAGGSYVLFTPGAVGRPDKYDDHEFDRAAEAIRILGDDFQKSGVKAALEPVRAAEVSFGHTIEEIVQLIDRINHPAVQHICGDLYHILAGESHIGEAILAAGQRMVNLHMADSNRRALGDGVLDLDMVIMSLYVIGYNQPDHFCTAEPLGPGGDPYPARFGKPDPRVLEERVQRTATYFRERERVLIQASNEELLNRFE